MNDASLPQLDVPQLRTLLLTDICDSTEIVEKLGDTAAADLFREHDALVLQLQQQWRGRLIDRSDGLLLLFERPIDGLGFALDYQRGLRDLGHARQLSLVARAGLHVGEVLTWRNSVEAVQIGAKPLEVEGLAKPVAARLMALARPGQILLSAVAESLARRASRDMGERGAGLTWRPLGHWRFKGLPTPLEIYQVTDVGQPRIRAPGNSPKAWRDIPLWRRPAALVAELLLVCVVGAGIWLTTRPAPALAFSERDWVVIGELRNLTGDVRYDASLDNALRIGLEQSRFVNVVPEARVRSVLSLMGGRAKPMDRQLGAELSQRLGARLLLIPTVAEEGNKLRIGVDVIDPATQDVVASAARFADGDDSVVHAMGEVSDQLRGLLGESPVVADRTAAPLEQVTTSNLTALRAFTLGQKAYAVQDLGVAEQLFNQALQIDPGFAMARIGLARIAFNRTNTAGALEQARLALEDESRLSDRERLYAAATLSMYQWEPGSIEKWKALSDLYPDYDVAAFNTAMFMRYANRYDDMLRFTARAANAKGVTLPAGLNLKAVAQLGLGDPHQAISTFAQSRAQGYRHDDIENALAKAALSEFDAALGLLHPVAQEPPFVASEREAVELNILVDMGKLDVAQAKAKALIARLDKPEWPFDWAARASALAVLRRTDGKQQVLVESRRLLDAAQDALPEEQGRAREAVAAAALYAGYAAAAIGDSAMADKALQVTQDAVSKAPAPILENFAAIVRARSLTAHKQPTQALRVLSTYDETWALELTKVERSNAEREIGMPAHPQETDKSGSAGRAKTYAEWAAERPPPIDSLSLQ